jgi:hypothetical protein
MNTTTKERKLQPSFDRKGNPEWRSTTSPPDATVATIAMVPDRIIPIIFVPGVMGSNLQGIGVAKGQRWRLDSTASMGGWLTKNAVDRKKILTPTTMVVDDDGVRPEGTQQHSDELKRRGWGEVGAMSYATFLVWLENALNDHTDPHSGERAQLVGMPLGAMSGELALTKQEVALSYKYRFPVHACGYNWLDDNVSAAKQLKARIEKIIARYRGEKKMCEKVIVVTHSMGGLVARYCSEVLGMSNQIMGIVHGVMPAIGAAAVYRRFKSGTEGDRIPAMVLGNNGAEMTAVLSAAPGPMQLLPTAEYGNNWLKIKEGTSEVSFPRSGDPYREIYTVRDKWWSMCDDEIINPLNRERDVEKHDAIVDKDWRQFVNIIKAVVKPFHEDIAGKYHPNSHVFFGCHEENRAYGNITWRGVDDSANDLLIRGNRPADSINARHLDSAEVTTRRTVAAKLGGAGWKTVQRQIFTVSSPDEAGDGTVPRRSGIHPQTNKQVKSVLQVKVGHEPAFRDSTLARRFTLRAIVQIAQDVKTTSLHYV